jgi:DNA-formamidopyrimidine glycosylase
MSPRGGDLLRHRDFQKLWAGQTVSQLGSQVSQLALPLVAVLVLHVSAFYVALLGTVDLLPFLLFALPAGVWIDRIPRRPVLIVADAGRALALASVPIVAAFGTLTIWQLYAVGFVTGTFTVFFDVAYQSYLPSLVGRPHLVEGNAKLELSRSAAQIAGPGVGGVLVGAITAPYAIVVDSVSFAVSALLLERIRKREPTPEPTATHNMRAELMEGLRYVLGDPRWRAITLYVSTFNFFTGVAFALYVVYAVRSLGLTPGELGLVLALGNLGWLLGAVVVRRLSGRLGLRQRRAAPARPARAEELRHPVPRHVGSARRAGDRPLQRHGDQPDPDADAGPAARPRQRVAALDRVGDDSARQPRRRRALDGDRGSADAVRRDDRRELLLPVPARAVAALDQDASGSGRRAGAARRRRRARPRGPVRGGLARYADPVPELPEMEAWRRALNDPVSAFPVAKARPAHIATLKTFDPPLAALEGRRLSGAGRRGKRLLFPTDDGELVLLVHLMPAGRLKMLKAGEAGPKTPAFALGFEGGSKLVLTENARKKRAGVWLLTPEAAEQELAHLGPEALGLDATALAEILRRESHRLHPLLRDQRAIAGIGRAWANEILHTAKLSPYALSTDLSDEEVARLAAAMNEELARGLELRERGADNEHTYRVHNRLGQPCHVCGTPIAQIDFEEHTIYYCPECQTGGRVLKDRRMSRLLR